MILSLVPATRAVLEFMSAHPELPEPAGLCVRTTVSLVPEPVRVTLPDLHGGRHFGAICAWATALGVEHVEVIRERDCVELVVAAELPDRAQTPVRVASTAIFEPAMVLVAELPLGLDEPLRVHVAALHELADLDALDGVRLDELRRHWYGTAAGPIEQDVADELGELPPAEGQDADPAMLTIPADVLDRALNTTTAELDMDAELDARDEVFLTELAAVSAASGGGESQ